MGRSYMDLLMEQIPGKDNVPANLTDDVLNAMTDRLEAYPENDPRRATRGTAINKQHVLGPLNTGYYSRYFVAGSDAMGRRNYKRGYNDPNLFAAMTTHSEIANVSTIKSGSHIRPGEVCMVDGKACPRIQQRWTYAMPVELIYLTPLFNWNPHNIEVQSRKNKDCLKGSGTAKDPYNHACQVQSFYRTPSGFFGSCAANISEPPDTADTDRSAVYIKEGKEGGSGGSGGSGLSGKVVSVMASGVSIVTNCIPGVGKVRMRYNIMPIYEDGSTSWKEVKALQTLVEEKIIPSKSEPEPEPEPGQGSLMLKLAGGTADHQHEVALTADQLKLLRDGQDVWATSTQVESHTHSVELKSVRGTNGGAHGWDYVLEVCKTGGVAGPSGACIDKHNALTVETQSAR